MKKIIAEKGDNKFKISYLNIDILEKETITRSTQPPT
jgi:hypothetical protein